MSHTTRSIVLVATLAALSACASGPDTPKTNRGQSAHFTEMDKSGDKLLTLDEINPELELSTEFPRWDANGNGSIEEHEFRAYVEAQ